MMVNNAREIGNLAILGSTGSIGTQTLDIVRRNPGRFNVVGLAAHTNVALLREQIVEFAPVCVSMSDPAAAEQLRTELAALTLPFECEVLAGDESIGQVATRSAVHTVVAGIVGFAGLPAMLDAIAEGKHIALANKEALIAAGGLIRERLLDSESVIAPVDSEHNSLFQCTLGRPSGIRRMIITASGGPFLNHSVTELAEVTVEQAVQHPNWDMGAKISIDSATLMNKGLEVIEAAMLFDLEPDLIQVLVHPQSIVHGLVEYDDGMSLAAMYHPDMRVPISFAIEYLRSESPKESPGTAALSSGCAMLDLAAAQNLQFFQPDLERFPALALAYRALNAGASMPTVLNAANEVAVAAFCERQIAFCDIAQVVREVMLQHELQVLATIEDIMHTDTWARDTASKYIVQTSVEGRAQI